MTALPHGTDVRDSAPEPCAPHGADTGPSCGLSRPSLLAGLLLAGCLLGAAHHIRPAPYGDRLATRVGAQPAVRTGGWAARVRGDAVEGRPAQGGVPGWRYAREGRRPLYVLPARGDTIALWDDGLVTATDGRSVRWHRALPDADEWLPAQGGTGVLRPLGRGILAVVTPHRVTAYRTADGDLRWVLPAHRDCAFRPERALRRGPALLIAQPCPSGAWTGQLVAVDGLGRITPDRTPLGNDLAGRSPARADPEKPLAQPR
ncbi:hypothetical protein [Streptomyces sp. NPDC002671]